MRSKRKREATMRWLGPAATVVALLFLAVVAILLGSDSPLLAVLVIPIAPVLVAALIKSFARRPRVSLDAAVTGWSTSSRADGTRIVSSAVVVLFLHNAERGGEGKHCKVELTTVAAPDFVLDSGIADATRHLLGDTWRIVWQPPGVLGPGGERELKLRSSEFAFDEAVRAKVRVTADRMDPLESILELRVSRYDPNGAAELSVTV